MELSVRTLVFPLEGQQLQRAREGWAALGPVTGSLILHLQMKLQPGSLIPAVPKTRLCFQVAAAALGKNTFFFSAIQTITGPYQLLLKIKHGPRAVHCAGSRAVCNHALSGFGRKSFNKIKPNSESIHFSHSIQ